MAHPLDIHAGKRIRQARQLKGMTQVTLAEKLGCSFQQLQKYETGYNRISFSRLVMVCRELDISPTYIFEGLGFDGEKKKADEAQLSRAESELILTLRGLDDKQREAVKGMIQSMT